MMPAEREAGSGGWVQAPRGGLRALPANLCPGLAGSEVFCDGDDLCESVGESVEARAGRAVSKL